MTKRSVVICVVLLVLWTCPATGQDSLGVRTSLVINEIMPSGIELAADETDRYPWIEFFNPHEYAVDLSEIEIFLGQGRKCWIPEGLLELPEEKYLLLVFDQDPPVQEGELGPSSFDISPTGNVRVHLPRIYADLWTRAGGELAITRRGVAAHEPERTTLDYLAWGRPGGDWSSHHRDGLWPGAGHVVLDESFGLHKRDAELPPGASIGVYPLSSSRGPEHWVVFDPLERSPLERNNVPRPKTFNLPDGAQIGSQSFSLAWPQHLGDERYRFQLARDREFTDVVVDEIVDTSVIRIGESLNRGIHYYRVFAQSSNLPPSKPSVVGAVTVFETICDWPVPNLAEPAAFFDWIKSPSCMDDTECNIISSIKMKFQRKDTSMLCLECARRRANDLCFSGYCRCGWDHPHPTVAKICFSKATARPCYRVLVGSSDLSPTCADPVFEPPQMPAEVRSAMTQGTCVHGNKYCVMASVSMMASAYGGRCISQDRVAYEATQLKESWIRNEENFHDLRHNRGVWCQPVDGGGDCTNLLRWVLGENSPSAVLPGPPGSELLYLPNPPEGFQDVIGWIRDGRPIMTMRSSDDHMRVIGGYCVEPSFSGGIQPPKDHEIWVYVFDPMVGPIAQTLASWRASSSGTWVGTKPHRGDFRQPVRWDDLGIWLDTDGDELSNFDEACRFNSSITDSDTDGDGINDKDQILPPEYP